MDTTDTTPSTLLLRSLGDTVGQLADMPADEVKFRAKQQSMGILSPIRNKRFRTAVRVKKATRAALVQRLIQLCEQGRLSDFARIADVWHGLHAELRLDSGDRKSERQRALGRRRDAAEQLLLATVSDELQARGMIR